jgi:hypothetical protein
MAHEMVHAFDHLRFKVNWSDNLRHAACTEVCVILVLTCQCLLNPFRFELVRSAASADGPASSSEEGNGSLHSSTKSASDEEPSCLCEHAQLVKTKPMPQGSSMRSGIAVSETHAHLMRSTDDTATHAVLYYSAPFCMIDIVWMYYISLVSLAIRTFPIFWRFS